MFSYIYADDTSKGINYFVAAQRKETLDQVAIDNIRNMAYNFGLAKTHMIFKVLDSNNAQNAIETWNQIATDELKQHVIYHKIEPMKLIE